MRCDVRCSVRCSEVRSEGKVYNFFQVACPIAENENAN